MDDPDVDHELIALLRESLGFSNKAQDGVSSNTGKAHTFFVTVICSYNLLCYSSIIKSCDIFSLSGIVAVLLTLH